MEQKQTEKRKLSSEEKLAATKRRLAFQQKLAREGKLSEFLKERRERLAKDDPDWDVLLK